MRPTRASSAPSERRSIASLSRAGLNPYLDLLYRHLAAVGVPTGPPGRLAIGWLLAQRRKVRYLHVHWPEGLYRFERGPARLRTPLSWVKLGLLEARLRLARALGYRLVWTIHQVYPHGTVGRLDRLAARLLARHSTLLLAHDPETAAHARSELTPQAETIEVIGHGSYLGVYAEGRPRAAMRRAHGIAEEAVVFLCFGELRANSEVEVVLQAFANLRVDIPTALVVAGHAKDERAGTAVARARAKDDRILRIDGFIPAEDVREIFEAADVAVVARGDGGTSGSLILALSLGLPVIAADRPTNRRLLADGAAGWLFQPGDPRELQLALETATRDDLGRAERALAARRVAETLDWNKTATRLASLLER